VACLLEINAAQQSSRLFHRDLEAC
jgi:hypothetical protein